MSTPVPSAKPLGCRLNINHLWRWEYPPEGKKFARCQKCGKINDNWVGSNWTESWSKHLDASAQNPESAFFGVGRRPTGEDGQDLITEAANAYGDASRASEELLQRRGGPAQAPTDDELKAALLKRDAAERAWRESFVEGTWRKPDGPI